MEFVLQVINTNALTQVLPLLPSFHDIQVEVIVLPIENKKNNQTASPLFPESNNSIKPVKHSAFGRLNAYANPSLMQEEKGAWEKAAAEKYASH